MHTSLAMHTSGGPQNLLKTIAGLLFTGSALLAQAPQPQPQPNQQFYGTQLLQTFPTYTRASYLQAFGTVPACDPTRQIKTWFDSTVDTSQSGNLALYYQLAPNATVESQYVLPASEAATVNLPGVDTYPAYTVAPTDATVVSQGAPNPSGINPIYLSTQAQADAMEAALGAVSIVQETLQGPYGYVFPADESRRLYDIVFANGQAVNVGSLLNQMNAAGVGAPGHWNVNGIDSTWVPDPPASGCPNVTATRPVPVRPLLPNEKLQAGLMGVMVVRTDLQAAANQLSNVFTTTDRATLNMILSILQDLAAKQ